MLKKLKLWIKNWLKPHKPKINIKDSWNDEWDNWSPDHDLF